MHSFLTLDGALDPSRSAYYTNISGYFHGGLTLHNLSAPDAPDRRLSPAPWGTYATDLMSAQNASRVAERLGTWNWTTSDKVTVNAVDRTAPHTVINITEDVSVVHVCAAFLSLLDMPDQE
jgi:transmembrane E3 ubiquitin-protein ligase